MAISSGRAVVLNNNNNGVNGNNNLNNHGHFVGVAQEGSARSDAQNLETEIQAALGQRIAPTLLGEATQELLAVALRYVAQPQE